MEGITASALGLMLIHGSMVAWSASCHSPVFNEVGSLPAGLSNIQLGRYDLYSVNPPLVRMIASVGVRLANPTTDWKNYVTISSLRMEVPVGIDFLYANGPRAFWYYTLGRWMCIPFSLLGGYTCFCWARKLYGDVAGLMAMILWCFCPYVLGHASLMTPDAHAAAMGIAAAYTFWLWLREPCWDRALLMGLVLGLAELCKFTLLVFYPLWIVLWILYRLSDRRELPSWQWRRELLQFSTMIALSVLIINIGYEFEGSFQQLGDYRFQSEILIGAESWSDVPVDGGNRFADTWLGSLPIPVPKNYLQGIDTQKLDFERGMLSYLHGEWKMGGWWYYYLYALAIKIPLGTWALLLFAINVSLFVRGYSVAWQDEMVLLLSAITILTLVSSQTGFNIHSRYVLPMLPFAYVLISKVGRCVPLRQWRMAAVVGVMLCWSVGSSLWYYPHCLSYFNEIVGGPKNGHYHLLDSNIAWGQDLLLLKSWLDEHPEATPLHLATFGWIDPRLTDIKFALPPLGPDPSYLMAVSQDESLGPKPGWYALDVNHLHSTNDAVVDAHGEVRLLANKQLNYHYFLHFQPVAMAGYSIYIYHITLDEANRVRRKLGLPEIKAEGEEWKAED